jgi:phosphoserine phosphatase
MNDAAAETLLLTLTGPDRPGVTRRVCEILADHDVVIIDIEQIVVRAHLTLSFLVTLPVGRAQLQEFSQRVSDFGSALGFDVRVHQGEAEAEADTRLHGRFQITVMGAPLRPSAISRVASEIADRGVHFGEVFATLYHQLGIDASRVTLPDLTGRPHYLVDGWLPMPELITG